MEMRRIGEDQETGSGRWAGLIVLSLSKKVSLFPTSSSYCSSHHRVALMSLTPNCEDPTRGLIPKEIQAEKLEERNENTPLQEQSMCYEAFTQCTPALPG